MSTGDLRRRARRSETAPTDDLQATPTDDSKWCGWRDRLPFCAQEEVGEVCTNGIREAERMRESGEQGSSKGEASGAGEGASGSAAGSHTGEEGRRRAVDRAFQEALDQPDDEIGRFMDALRARDPAIHDEVVRLLQMSDEAEGFDEVVRTRLPDTLLHEIAEDEPDEDDPDAP